jgi:hypothetical protein
MVFSRAPGTTPDMFEDAVEAHGKLPAGHQ